MDINEFAFNLQIILTMNNIYTFAFRRSYVIISRSINIYISFHLQIILMHHDFSSLSFSWFVIILRFSYKFSFRLQIIFRLLLNPSGLRLSSGFLTSARSPLVGVKSSLGLPINSPSGLRLSGCFTGVRFSAGTYFSGCGLSKSPSGFRLSVVRRSAGATGAFSGLSKSPSGLRLSFGFLTSALSPFLGTSSFGRETNSPSGFKLSCGFFTTGLSAGLNSSGLGLSNSPSGFRLSECLIGVRRSAGPIGFFSGLSKSPSGRKLSCGFLISALSPFFGASSFGLDTNSPSGFKLSCGFFTIGLSAGLNSSGIGLSNSPSGFRLSECLIGVRFSAGPIGFFSGLSKSPSGLKLSLGFFTSALSPFLGASSLG
ncbi:hypothetical protein ALC57_18476 [Trachymyrmex cornetzi]|uniref:Uncharacterized protein n=1 Tax=Trachymyrmex cornetzi TaxID=471704 RepID=A0A151IS29_9HYME|nr:hypothetical protein ALC57_18476 [Trachymyrmex cornetzi]